MYALARYLTGSRGAAVVAGMIFAFAPYRFEHYMHMELQWTMWMPLAFLALHRTYDTGRWKYGLATGGFLALQMMSSIYYGIFLGTLLGLGAVLLFPGDRQVAWRRAAVPLATGLVLAAAVCALYSRPFLRVHQEVGDRPTSEVDTFSARPFDYLVAPPGNWLYGRHTRPGHPERRLFPGVIPVVMTIAGLLLVAPSRRALVYLLLLVAAFDLSTSSGGYLYPLLSAHLSAYRSLRAFARLGIFVVMFLAVLSAYGSAIIAQALSARWRRVFYVALAAGLMVEYRSRVVLAPFPSSSPAIYKILAQQPRGVVAEFPAPRPNSLPGSDPEYAYMSTFHWFPLVNGYSGNYPVSYLSRMEALSRFPDARSLAQLRRDGVRYLVVHGGGYAPEEIGGIRAALVSAGMVEFGQFADVDGQAFLYTTR